jgi:hypothetical protein
MTPLNRPYPYYYYYYPLSTHGSKSERGKYAPGIVARGF